MDKTTLAKAIEGLEKVRQRPAMFIGTVTVESMDIFLGGFTLAFWAFDYSQEFEREATYKRGWTFPPIGPIPQMREKGYSEEQIIDELIMVKITALQTMMEPEDDLQDELRPEYHTGDLKDGVRGKYLAEFRSGTNHILLDPDVAKAYPTAEAVNQALRRLMQSPQG